MSNSGRFEHSSNQWRADRIPAGWTTNGENLGQGYTSATAVMAGWMKSEGHKQNILRSTYTHIGVGYVANGNYWVQIFAGYSPAKAPTQPPFGAFDSAGVSLAGTNGTLTATGWAVDGAAPSTSTQVHVYVTDPAGKQVGYVLNANLARPDVGTAFRQAGSAHGFEFSTPVTLLGNYKLCAYAIGKGANVLLGCKTAGFGPGVPTGNVEELAIDLVGGVPTLKVRGWALDNAARSVENSVHVYVLDPSGKSVGTAIKPTIERPDVAAAFPGAGPNQGFSFTQRLTQAGNYTVCVYSIGAPQLGSSNKQLSCRVVKLGPSALVGAFDAAQYSSASRDLLVSGWSIDLGLAPLANQTHVYVTEPSGTVTGYVTESDSDRPDVGRAFAGAGAAHGFELRIPVEVAGEYKICAYAIANPILGSGNALLGCKTSQVS